MRSRVGNGRVVGIESLDQREGDGASGRVTQPLRRASRDLPIVGLKVVQKLRNVNDETVTGAVASPRSGCRLLLRPMPRWSGCSQIAVAETTRRASESVCLPRS